VREAEIVLAGGNTSGEVVRIGDTVRKAWTASTPSVHAFLRGIADAGIDVPAVLGRDERGRQVLEHVPGRLAMDGPPLATGALTEVGRLVRRIHDASAGFRPSGGAVWETAIPAPGAELVCHNDLAPWNLVVGGERLVFIDWDAAAPSTRLWDLAYAAQSFTLNDASASPEEAARRLRALVDGYDADAGLREALPEAIVARAAAMRDFLERSHATGREPWASMHADGHGAHWRAVTRYAAAHRAVWRRILLA